MEAVNPFKLSTIVYTKLHHQLLDVFCASIDNPRIRIFGGQRVWNLLSLFICLRLFGTNSFPVELAPKKELNFSSFKGLGLSEN